MSKCQAMESVGNVCENQCKCQASHSILQTTGMYDYKKSVQTPKG
jgi:hypothetical protein